MEKLRYKVTLNWQGEVHTIYRHATSSAQALRHAIRELARKVGYSTKHVQSYIMDTGSSRWEVKIV